MKTISPTAPCSTLPLFTQNQTKIPDLCPREILLVKTADIEVEAKNRRAVVSDKFEAIQTSIEEIGLQTPIWVQRYKNEAGAYVLKLVAGMHRLYACLALQHKEILALVYETDRNNRTHQCFMEVLYISENLDRAELSELDKARMTLRYLELRREMGSLAMAGDNQSTIKEKMASAKNFYNAQQMADELGVGRTTLFERTSIAKNVQPKVQRLISGTPLSNRVTDLHLISRVGSKELIKANGLEKKALEIRAIHPAKSEKSLQEVERIRDQVAELQFAEIDRIEAIRAIRKTEPTPRPNPNKLTVECLEPEALKPRLTVQLGEWWTLGDRHSLLSVAENSEHFRQACPKQASLAILELRDLKPGVSFYDDWLEHWADVVAVIPDGSSTFPFCYGTAMTYRHMRESYTNTPRGRMYQGIYIFSKKPLPILEQSFLTLDNRDHLLSKLIVIYSRPGSQILVPNAIDERIAVLCEHLEGRSAILSACPETAADILERWERGTKKTFGRGKPQEIKAVAMAGR